MRYKALLLIVVLFSLAQAAFAAQGDPPSSTIAPYIALNAPIVAIEHVRVIDGTGAGPATDRTVVFAAGKIASIGPSSSASVPAGAKIVDGTNRTLMPGYVGTHNHLFTGVVPRAGMEIWREQPFSFPILYLAAGTTTIRTTGSFEPELELHVKQAIDAGEAIGPHIDVTSPYLTGPGGGEPQMVELRDAADARETVDFWADRGITSYKVYDHITHETLAAVIDEAHKRGLKVMGHLCTVGFSEAADLGIDELEHGLLVDTEFTPGKQPDKCPDQTASDRTLATIDINGAPMQAMIADLIKHHVVVSSTLPVFTSFAPQGPPRDTDAISMDLLAPEQRAMVTNITARIKKSARLANFYALVQKEMQFERAFVAAGGVLSAGPDPSGYGRVIAGPGDWQDLQLLVQAGFTPVQAIHIASQDGAIALGRADSIGTLQAGKNADAILVRGDPSANINDVENVEVVFKDGVGYDSKKLFAAVRGLVGRT